MQFSSDDVVPLQAFTPSVLSRYLSLTDSRDKLVKGVGNLFKITAHLTGNPHHAKMAAACSDARSIMRFCVWINNIKKIEDAVNAADWGSRTILFIARVVLDGIFSFCDNIAYFGKYFCPKDPILRQIGSTGRGSLFFGYVFAVIIDFIDLLRTVGRKQQVNKALTLTRNAFDMISTVGNVFPVDIGSNNASILGFLSAVIATREQLIAATNAEKSK